MHGKRDASVPLWIPTILCVLGLAVSIELTRIHLLVHTDPEYHSVCALSEGVNCETVAISPYSVFLGLPVSVWGILGYAIMGVFALWSFCNKRFHSSWPIGILLVLTGGAVVASAILAYISATRIDSLCLFCMSSYAINIVLFLVCLVAALRTKIGVSKLLLLDLKGMVLNPLLAGVLGGLGVFVLVLLELYVPSYWRTPGWDDLPMLDFGTDENGHHWIGAAAPTVTVVEFSDYECPHCRNAHKAIRTLAAKYPDKVRLIHRHLPLDKACHPGLKRPFHKRACLFARAAECAGEEERFWAMNDALFSIQDTMKTEDVDPEEIAVRLGLNRSSFKACMESDVTVSQISKDINDAMEKKLRGTPSFLIEDRLFVGRIPEKEIEKYVGEDHRTESSVSIK